MKISFHGGAKTVTGSKHLISLANNEEILLDCGMFQGLDLDSRSLNKEFGFDPKSIDYLILSHAHIDHSGLIPKLVKDGFKGPIYCTCTSSATSASGTAGAAASRTPPAPARALSGTFCPKCAVPVEEGSDDTSDAMANVALGYG